MKVIDNFLKPDEFNKVKELLFHPNFEWYYEDHMVSTDHCFFNHCFYSHNKVRTNYFHDVEFILEKLNCVSLVSLRNNLVIGKKESYESEWHTDYNYKNCKTAILYFNDCNAKTLLKTPERTESVDTKANRVVIFPTTTKHKMVSQTDTKRRVIMNINYF
tara:strand:- start:1023 stop:1502 length:480 start_codon:yes stop_codon:yes gene_type:complete